MNIIVLMGWKGSGKDTVAEYLENTYNFYHLKFAKYIKNAANSIFPNLPLTYNELQTLDVPKGTNVTQKSDYPKGVSYWEIDKDTPREEFGGRTKRDVLVDLAKYLKSKYGDGIFTKNLNRELELLYEQCIYSNVVISDLRFMVEFDWLKTLKHKVYFWDIKRFPTNHGIEIYTEYLNIQNKLVYDSSLNYNLIINNGKIKQDLYKLVDLEINKLELGDLK